MAYLPSLGTYDLAALVASLLVVAVAYAFFSRPVRIVAWLVVFIIHLGWMAFFLQKWLFETEA